LKFTIYHGLAVSLVLHSLVGSPFVVYGMMAPDDDSEVLVVDLQGIESDTQTEQKVLAETKGSEKQEQAAQAKPVEAPPPPPPPPPADLNDEEPPPTPTPPKPQQNTNPTPVGAANNIKGVDEKQDAQRILTEKERLNIYIAQLSKKVRAHLIYPDDFSRASAKVAFSILASGQIRPDSLKIAESSGQAALDESAIKTIRASLPFDPPPHEINLAIMVDFTRKR
jgi:periplasmic protein TonB